MSKSIHMPSVHVFGNCLATLLSFSYLFVCLYSLDPHLKGFEVIFNKILYTLSGKMETARGNALKRLFLSYGRPQVSLFSRSGIFPSDKIARGSPTVP